MKALEEALLQMRSAGIALVFTASLGRTLEGALRTKMTTLNRKVDNKLFGDFGSLRDLSTKIDLAFALELINSDSYKRLHTLRKIRVVFAHTDELVNFHTPAVQKLICTLTDEASAKANPEGVFISVGKEIENAIALTTGWTAKELHALTEKDPDDVVTEGPT